MSEKNPTEESTPTQVATTPGPWEFDLNAMRVVGPRAPLHASRWLIVKAVSDEEVDAANLRLIAAAPDLLAACKLAVIALEDGIADMSPGQIFDVLAAAINKSEGR